jgi:hypothetical protein
MGLNWRPGDGHCYGSLLRAGGRLWGSRSQFILPLVRGHGHGRAAMWHSVRTVSGYQEVARVFFDYVLAQAGVAFYPMDILQRMAPR